MSDQKQIDDLKKYIAEAEESLEAAKKALADITGEDFDTSDKSSTSPVNLKVTADGKIIEGIFNGENMIGPEGKVFSVPANYASKSKLIEGDKLKLSVAEDGSFIFKQIGPVERKKLVGELIFEDNSYYVKAEGRKYAILHAAVTFNKVNPGDKVTIVVPAHGDSTWAALENVIHDVKPAVDPKEDKIDLELPGEEEKGPIVAPAENPPNSSDSFFEIEPNKAPEPAAPTEAPITPPPASEPAPAITPLSTEVPPPAEPAAAPLTNDTPPPTEPGATGEVADLEI